MLKIGQNIKYDIRVLARYGIDMAPIDDTMLLSYVLEGGQHGHGMDELAKLHLDHTPSSTPRSPAAARPGQLRQGADGQGAATTPPRTPTSPCGCTGR